MAGVHFFGEKNGKKKIFSENRATRRQRRHSIFLPYTTGGYTVKTNTTDIHTVDSVYSKTIHQDMEEDHNTKAARDAGVEKHSCQIELRGAHVKLVYYNNKQVLRVYIMLHVTVVLYVRSEDERADTVSIHSSLCDNENPTTHSISVGLDA